jgi:hypothetical protein
VNELSKTSPSTKPSNDDNNSEKKKAIRDRALSALGTVVTIILTATLTGWYSSRDIKETITAQQQQWVAEKQYNIQSDLLKRRFDLLERFLKISRRQEELSSLKQQLYMDTNQIKVSLNDKNSTQVYEWIQKSAEDSNRFDELKGEYIAVLNLAAMLFGDKTRSAVTDIVATQNPDFWRASEMQIANMANSMSAEMFTNLGQVPGKSGTAFRAEAKPTN